MSTMLRRIDCAASGPQVAKACDNDFETWAIARLTHQYSGPQASLYINNKRPVMASPTRSLSRFDASSS
jgi:hypothetical protein